MDHFENRAPSHPCPPTTFQSQNLKFRVDNGPRRPMNAFIIFSKHRRREFAEQEGLPKLKTSIVSARLGEEWKAMPESEKSRFRKLAEQNRLQHKERFPDFKYISKPRRKRIKPSSSNQEVRLSTLDSKNRDESSATHSDLEPWTESKRSCSRYFRHRIDEPHLHGGALADLPFSCPRFDNPCESNQSSLVTFQPFSTHSLMRSDTGLAGVSQGGHCYGWRQELQLPPLTRKAFSLIGDKVDSKLTDPFETFTTDLDSNLDSAQIRCPSLIHHDHSGRNTKRNEFLAPPIFSSFTRSKRRNLESPPSSRLTPTASLIGDTLPYIRSDFFLHETLLASRGNSTNPGNGLGMRKAESLLERDKNQENGKNEDPNYAKFQEHSAIDEVTALGLRSSPALSVPSLLMNQETGNRQPRSEGDGDFPGILGPKAMNNVSDSGGRVEVGTWTTLKREKDRLANPFKFSMERRHGATKSVPRAWVPNFERVTFANELEDSEAARIDDGPFENKKDQVVPSHPEAPIAKTHFPNLKVLSLPR
ncbi:hypothetical protein IE53DRAFT_120317 [Violaceomyces palustris]|uniref:Uncharacterized protein n=1 Tax=Violaceomyces palustris TaxID=1673888 RepID=A0ACD0NVV9_9BASI|nr:hypothetical protein IE53DRAFT_120317 [Violaceomyces palustris]